MGIFVGKTGSLEKETLRENLIKIQRGLLTLFCRSDCFIMVHIYVCHSETVQLTTTLSTLLKNVSMIWCCFACKDQDQSRVEVRNTLAYPAIYNKKDFVHLSLELGTLLSYLKEGKKKFLFYFYFFLRHFLSVVGFKPLILSSVVKGSTKCTDLYRLISIID